MFLHLRNTIMVSSDVNNFCYPDNGCICIFANQLTVRISFYFL